VVVEARVSVLEALYHRQPILRELVGGSWVHLSVVDPDTGDICVFNPGTGFVSWQASSKKPPRFASSPDYYRQQTGPLPPALILRPDSLGA